MNWNEVVFKVLDVTGNNIISKKSVYDINEGHEYNDLKIGQLIEIEHNGMIKDCKIVSKDWGDYNISGFVLTYGLKLKYE